MHGVLEESKESGPHSGCGEGLLFDTDPTRETSNLSSNIVAMSFNETDSVTIGISVVNVMEMRGVRRVSHVLLG